MVNVNFVPDDYAQGNECRRTNFMYIVLLAVMMMALGGSYVAIMIRQRACMSSERVVNERLSKMQEAIKQFEELGLKFTGSSPDGRRMEILEFQGHPYYSASQFHPELKSRPMRPAPLYVGLIRAIVGG